LHLILRLFFLAFFWGLLSIFKLVPRLFLLWYRWKFNILFGILCYRFWWRFDNFSWFGNYYSWLCLLSDN